MVAKRRLRVATRAAERVLPLMFLLQNAGEDDGERGDADAGELVGREGRVAVYVSEEG
jgi:hypothetical protein